MDGGKIKGNIFFKKRNLVRHTLRQPGYPRAPKISGPFSGFALTLKWQPVVSAHFGSQSFSLCVVVVGGVEVILERGFDAVSTLPHQSDPNPFLPSDPLFRRGIYGNVTLMSHSKENTANQIVITDLRKVSSKGGKERDGE